MKLNNKGFAISSIMYIILIMAVILISVTLAILSSRKLILDKIKKETTDNIYGISYNSVINTLKHEAINYASSNNIEKDNIKIGDFETSVSQDLLEHHELLDKYLTLSKNNYSYDVYLGQTKTVTDISKPISNMLGIIDYKIEGNSYQQTYTGKNLFDISKVISSANVVNNGDGTLSVTPTAGSSGVSAASPGTLKDYAPSLEVGKTYYLNATTTANKNSIYFNVSKRVWVFGKTLTITEDDLNSSVYWYANGTDTSFTAVISNIQIVEGTKATAYEPYVGGAASPNPQYPQEIISVGERTKNIADLSQSKIATTTKHVTFDYDNSTGTLEYTSAPTQYDYVMIYLQRDVGYEFELGKTYYYGADITVTGKQTSDRTYIVFGINYSGGSTPSFFVTENGEYRQEGEFTYTGQETIRLLIHANYGSIEPAQVKFENIYVSEVDEFEPYRDNYNIPITVRGKNLVDNKEIKKVNNWTEIVESEKPRYIYPLDLKPGEYFINGDFSKEDDGYLYIQYSTDNGNSWTSAKKMLIQDKISNLNFTVSDNEKWRLWAANTNTIGYIKWLQIESGNTGTEYEDYIEPVTTNIYIDEPLRKIEGYKDSLNYKEKTIERKIYNQILNGSENWKNRDNYYNETSNTFYLERDSLAYTMKYGAKSVISTHFKNTGEFVWNNSSIIEGICGYSGNLYYDFFMKIKNSTIGSTENIISDNVNYFKEWLNESKPSVNYVLDTPINLTNVVLSQIQTNIGSSVIEVDTSILPSNVEFTVIEKIRKL